MGNPPVKTKILPAETTGAYKPESNIAEFEERIENMHQKLEQLQGENKKVQFSLNDYALKSEIKK